MDLVSLLNDHYKNILFTLVKFDGLYAIYAAKISTLLERYTHTITVTVPHYLAIKKQVHLPEIVWNSFQTRSFLNSYNIVAQSLPNEVFSPTIKRLSDIKLYVKNRTCEKTEYECKEYPEYQFELLHNLKKKSRYQFHDVISLSNALNTWNCVIIKTTF
jgi:hypothetical protein